MTLRKKLFNVALFLVAVLLIVPLSLASAAGPLDARSGARPEDDACPPVLYFDEDASGNPLAAGTIVDDEYAAYGITVSTTPVAQRAMIFDSSNPTGGDPDLGTPNEDFGGPGIGNAGGSGQPGANFIPQRNVLIISEDGDTTDPDDDAGGGEIIFTFDTTVEVGSIGLLDIEESGGEVRAYDAATGGNLLATVAMLEYGDNSYQSLGINTGGVLRLEVEFGGSGAVPFLAFCGTPPSAVDLVSFTGKSVNRGIRLDWETASEIDNLGFNIYRAESERGEQVQINGTLIPSQAPGSMMGAFYKFVDPDVKYRTTYYYWLEDVDVYGKTTRHGPVVVTYLPRALPGIQPRIEPSIQPSSQPSIQPRSER